LGKVEDEVKAEVEVSRRKETVSSTLALA